MWDCPVRMGEAWDLTGPTSTRSRSVTIRGHSAHGTENRQGRLTTTSTLRELRVRTESHGVNGALAEKLSMKETCRQEEACKTLQGGTLAAPPSRAALLSLKDEPPRRPEHPPRQARTPLIVEDAWMSVKD